jgi:hypothetical protein
MPYQDALRHAFSTLDPLAALRAPTDALLGVDTDAKAALSSLGLDTVFDLATSPLFRLASDIAAAVQGRDSSGLARFDRVPGGVAAPDSPVGLVDFAAADIALIRSLSPAQAAQLKTALKVEQVADLGRWPPYVAARSVLAVAGGVAETESDAASELVPRFGEFPTERHYYSTIVMDRVAVAQTSDLRTAGPLDILPSLNADFGFDAPAVGARLTFEQSWFAHGVTLGNLLHSVALAPGESTRVAVVDWSRQTSATGSETIGETESLTAATSHNRAISEIQDAVATEVQSGFSHTESKATTASGGGGFGFSMGPVSIGASGGAGTTTTSADSFSTSAGSRNLSASMSQQVADATHQAASSTRNRRATIVKEISETEHESVSTRILANYNHMHALTVQYFEVIEVYRVATGLHEAERCLFVPMKLVDFNERVITRFQGALAAAALNRRAFELLTTDFGMIRLSAARPMRPPLISTLGISTALRAGRDRLAAVAVARASAATPATPEEPTVPPPDPAPAPPAPPAAAAVPLQATWLTEEIRRASRLTASPLVRPGSESVLLPRDAQLEGISIALEGAGPPMTSVTVRRQSGLPATELTRTSIGWRVPGALPLDELLEIVVGTGAGEGRATGSMTLELSYREAFFPLTMPISAAANASTVVGRVGETEAVPELVEHLQANRLHYNQAIWRALDASTVALLLSKFTFEGMTVADLIDPRPIQVAGNYLVFRMPGFVARASLPAVRDEGTTPEAAVRRSWNQFLKDRGLTFGANARQESLVPVPTGGVFAEAVLGRSNSAEKLDMTRFWNWQDSPIPLQPPEIAAINLGSRAQPVDVTPGRLSQPVLNIVNPTSLPDPTGLGPMLGALQSGNMFRDMSGLAATIGLAQGVASEATSASNESQKLAAANLAVAAQKEVELARIAAQAVVAAAGNPAAMAGTPKNASEMGALINSATARDAAKKPGVAGGVSGSSSAPQGGGGGGFEGSGGSSGGGGVIPSNATFASDSGDGSLGDVAFRRALFGGLGAPAADVISAVTGGGGASGVTNPSGVASPVTLPNVGIGEIYFHANVKRIGDLRTFQQEIQAIQDGRWHPAAPDFRAISLRSGKFAPLRGDAEVSSLDEFFLMLTRPAMRFNFFSYLQTDPEQIPMNLQVQTNATASSGDTRNGFALHLLDVLSIQRLATLTAAGSSDPLAVAVRGIRTINTETRGSVRDESGNGVSRELRLYLCSMGDDFGPPPTPFGSAPSPFAVAQELATLLQMKVFALALPIVFRPHLQTDPLDEIRGQVSLSSTDPVVQDIHQFDPQMQEF